VVVRRNDDQRGAKPWLPLLSASLRDFALRAPATAAHAWFVSAAASRGDKEYPPSIVLGIGKDVSSGVFGVTSGVALAVGLYCVAQSNLLNILSGSTVNGWYVAGSLLVPYSWGLHVASWIQKQNGK